MARKRDKLSGSKVKTVRGEPVFIILSSFGIDAKKGVKNRVAFMATLEGIYDAMQTYRNAFPTSVPGGGSVLAWNRRKKIKDKVYADAFAKARRMIEMASDEWGDNDTRGEDVDW